MMENILAIILIVLISFCIFMVGMTFPPYNKFNLITGVNQCEQKLTREQHCILIAVPESEVKK